MPFESILADYFDLYGHHYLVIGDRLSSWSEVLKVNVGSSQSGAQGLCEALRQFFARFGVADKLLSDGGPEFTAGLTQDFLRRWNV